MVSVIVSFLDAAPFLSEAIESVLAQTYADWELILVDDGSIDAGSSIARRYAASFPASIRYVEHAGHANYGLTRSRNVGVSCARGGLLAFLDADDAWFPHKLERQTAILRAHPDCAMVCGTAQYWHSWEPAARTGDYIREPALPVNCSFDPPELLLRSYPLGAGLTPCPSDLLIRRGTLERVGGFEESFGLREQSCEDLALLAKVYLQERVYLAGECWTRYRIHPNSCTARAGTNAAAARQFYFRWLEGYLAAGVFPGRDSGERS